MEPIRVVSYNVRAFRHALAGLARTERSRTAIATALRALSAEIICLQEISAADDAEALARETPWSAHHFAAHQSRLYQTGLAILVDERRLRVTARSEIVLTDEDARRERRIGAHLALRDPTGAPLHVFTTHLSLAAPLGTRLGFGANQRRQVDRLLAFVRAMAGAEPLVIAGDLNARPESPVHRRLAGALDSPIGAPGPSAGLGPLRLRLDYLFAGNGVRWLDTDGTHAFGDRTSPFHGLSDHVPLISRCALPPVPARGTA